MAQQIWKGRLRQHSVGGPLGRLALVLTLAFLFNSIICRAQSTTSQIDGTVTDSSGAVVIGANIKLSNTATGIVYSTTSENLGMYHLTNLPPGSYTMEVTKTGFATQKLRAFKLVVDQQFHQDIALGVGETTQTVSVAAAALLLDTESSDHAQLIESQTIANMPLNGRDYLQLAQLSSGVAPVVPGMQSPATGWSAQGTVAIVMGGLREDDNSYLYDGVETRNAWYGAAGLLPDPDMIQEFNVENSGSSAQFGVGGAFVNVVTKSGSNQFHGNAYEFIRNNDFDARNYFDQGAPPPFHQNQFGASAGGPIKRNKMFFFANYEGFRQIQPSDDFNLVPTSQQIAGNFSANPNQLYNPYVLDPTTPTGYAVLPGNIVPTSFMNPIGQKILALMPAANGSYNNGTQNYFNVANSTNNWNQVSGRFDYSIATKDTAFLRYTANYQTAVTNGQTTHNQQVFPSSPKNLTLGWTHVFSPNLVNNVRYGWTHTAVGLQRGDGYNTALANPLGLQGQDTQPGGDGYPSIGITNYLNPGSTNGTDLVREGLNMWTESLMLQKGKHQLTGGLDIRYEPMYLYEDWSATSIGFNGSYSGDPVADLLMGVPNTTRTALGDPTMNLHMWYQAYYVEDNFKVDRNLTLNFGGRWEHREQPLEANNRVGSFDTATGQDLTYPATSVMGLGRNMVKPVYTNISPRFGFNWTPSVNRGLDVKGGFGLYFLQPNINQYEVEVDTTQLYEVDSFNNPAVGKSLAFNLSDLYSPTMTNGNFSGGGPTVSFIQPNGKTPYAYEWNLTVDRTVKNWLFEVAYLGSAEHHYEERPEIDPLNSDGVGSIWTQYSGVQENTESGSSIYNALIGRAEKRFSSGFSLMANYTFSKCLGMPWQDEFNAHIDMHLDRGHCAEDISDLFTANGIYELPFGRSKAYLNNRALTDAFVGGWKVAGIAQLRTGPWETLGSNQNVGFFDNSLPNVIGPVNNHSLHGGLGRHGRLGPYFNTQNVVPVHGIGVTAQGNSGNHNTQTPGSENFDLSGYKGWKFTESSNLTFRADFFNAFNRVNFDPEQTNSTNSNFGYVSSANAAREIQLSLRFEF
jgi:outer membrane receptor protein involved in Fe transport